MKEWHYEQSSPLSCVAACMCIVQKWRGQSPTEAQHYEKACDGFLEIGSVCSLQGAHAKRLGLYEDNEIIDHLMTDGIVVIGVDPWNYVPWQRSAYPDLMSKHGDLWTPGKYDRKRIHHAIVVLAWDLAGFWILDPWFPDNYQPLLIETSIFSKCFDAFAVFIDPMPPIT